MFRDRIQLDYEFVYLLQGIVLGCGCQTYDAVACSATSFCIVILSVIVLGHNWKSVKTSCRRGCGYASMRMCIRTRGRGDAVGITTALSQSSAAGGGCC